MTLAEIAVKLTANTTEFISGFGAAGTTAKRFRAEFETAFSSMGDIASRALAPLGEVGFVVGQAISQIGVFGATAAKHLNGLGGAAGVVATTGGLAAGALGAVGIASLGLAAHTAESIAKLNEQAQSAGVAVGAFYDLTFAGKAVGISAETMTKGLEKMSKSVFSAATAAPGAVNAFTRLHVAVRDAAGQILPTETIFTSLAGKFAAMPDGVAKTALAIQIFGRGGAELIPILNKGAEGVQHFLDIAKPAGDALQAAAPSAELFKEKMAELQEAGFGFAVVLTAKLLPALDAFVSNLAEGLKDSRSGINDFASGFAAIAKVLLATGETIWSVLRQIGVAVGQLGFALYDLAASELSVIGALAKGDFSGALNNAKEGYSRQKAILGSFINDSKKTWQDYAKFTAALDAPLLPGKPIPPGGGVGGADTDTKKAKGGGGQSDSVLARIQDRIDLLQREAINWADVAAAGTVGEALIAKATAKANEEIAKLNDLADRTKDPTKRAEAKKFIAQQEPTIRASAQSAFFDQTLSKTNDELAKHRDQLIEANDAEIAFAAAYKQGGAAIAAAAIDKEFVKESAALKQLKSVRDTTVGDLTLQESKALAAAFASNTLQTALNREDDASAALKPKIEALNAAYLKGADAVRAANIELQVQRFIQDELDRKVVVSTAMIEQKRAALQRTDKEGYDSALAQEAAQFSITAQYENQIVKLERIKKLMTDTHQSTLGVEAQIFDEQNRLIHQWDEWAGKVGTFKQKFQSVMGELIIQGRNAGAAIRDSFVSAIDGAETGLAKLLTGQKADFKAVFQNLAESVTKAEIQKGVGKLAEHFGLKIPGLTPKADGSDSNPFYVILKGATAGTAGAANVGSLFGALTGQAGGQGAATASTGGIGGFFSGLIGAFSGFHASGGYVPSGGWGIAGENGPEIISGPASVTPMRGGSTYNITHNHNYPTAESRDLFGRTQKQNQARQVRNMRLAHGF